MYLLGEQGTVWMVEKEMEHPFLQHVFPDSQEAQAKRTEREPLTNANYNMERSFETRFKLWFFLLFGFVFFLLSS